jgi:hypothetical protein
MPYQRWFSLVLMISLFVFVFPVTTQAQCMADTDQDRICDDQDPCPGDARNRCDDDSDEDGTPDSQDQCPDTRGISSNAGCPAPDRDGDGTEDSQDRCPDTGGPAWNGGCPEGENTTTETPNDGDGDAVPDSQDQCPNQNGLAAYQGCLPPLPEDGDCVAAPNSNNRVNIRALPLLTAAIVEQLDVEAFVLILEKIDTPDNPFYLSETGWIAGGVLRFGGDCDEVENPEPAPNCDETNPDCQSAETTETQENECGQILGKVIIAEGGIVRSFEDGSEISSFMPYGSEFRGGVNVATGDVNGDGVADIITGAGAGGGPHVKVFDGATGAELYSFMAYEAGFAGGVFVAAGDVDGDGFADIITGAGPGAGSHVKVFSGATGAEMKSFFAYEPGFSGGVRVAAGDVNGDGKADIIISPAGGSAGPHVKVFDGATGAVLQSFFAYSPSFTGGLSVAVGDVNGDCVADIVTGAGAGAAPHVKVFNGNDSSLLASFFAYDPSFMGGVSVAIGDVNGDGQADVITTSPLPSGAHVKVFDGSSFMLLASFMS